jgi:hypothetical protein
LIEYFRKLDIEVIYDEKQKVLKAKSPSRWELGLRTK